jgi:hypothetical protein
LPLRLADGVSGIQSVRPSGAPAARVVTTCCRSRSDRTEILEVGAIFTGGLEAEPLELARDVLGADEVARLADTPALHRVVGELVEPCPRSFAVIAVTVGRGAQVRGPSSGQTGLVLFWAERLAAAETSSAIRERSDAQFYPMYEVNM